MNCQQFQETLPYIIESGGGGDDESHLQTCLSCASLVQDLRYIAEQAKLLLPMHDPNPRVWSNIEQSLKREGLHATFQRGATDDPASGVIRVTLPTRNHPVQCDILFPSRGRERRGAPSHSF